MPDTHCKAAGCKRPGVSECGKGPDKETEEEEVDNDEWRWRGDANGNLDRRDKLLFILRQSFVLVCFIATALASQPKYIPLTFTALQRYDTLCHYTHNEPMVPGN